VKNALTIWDGGRGHEYRFYARTPAVSAIFNFAFFIFNSFASSLLKANQGYSSHFLRILFLSRSRLVLISVFRFRFFQPM
jgi:hypothetical protein